MHSSYHTHGLIETKLHRFSEILSVFRVFRKFSGNFRKDGGGFSQNALSIRVCFLAENDILAVQKNSAI
jgi:hypothetical protein